MKKELALRKELAVMRLRVARAELALSRDRRPDVLTSAAPLLTTLGTALEPYRSGRWGKYLRMLVRVARIALGVRSLL